MHLPGIGISAGITSPTCDSSKGDSSKSTRNWMLGGCTSPQASQTYSVLEYRSFSMASMTRPPHSSQRSGYWCRSLRRTVVSNTSFCFIHSCIPVLPSWLTTRSRSRASETRATSQRCDYEIGGSRGDRRTSKRFGSSRSRAISTSSPGCKPRARATNSPSDFTLNVVVTCSRTQTQKTA